MLPLFLFALAPSRSYGEKRLQFLQVLSSYLNKKMVQ